MITCPRTLYVDQRKIQRRVWNSENPCNVLSEDGVCVCVCEVCPNEIQYRSGQNRLYTSFMLSINHTLLSFPRLFVLEE